LDALRAELSFDPTGQPDRLTAHPNDAPRDAKRVLTRLSDGDTIGKPRAWMTTSACASAVPRPTCLNFSTRSSAASCVTLRRRADGAPRHSRYPQVIVAVCGGRSRSR
jgi:hypothetical protein